MDMEAGAALLLQSGILWVLLLLGGILVGIWLLVFYWQYDILRSLKEFPQGFEDIQGEVKDILQAIASYSPDDPPPYGSLVAGITRQVDKIANRLADLMRQEEDVRNQLHKLSPGSWQLILSAPFTILTWYRLERRTNLIRREINELKDTTVVAWEQVKDLDKQAWRLALRVRAVMDKKKAIHRLIDHLSDSKMYGDTFESIVDKEDQTAETLESIPHHFLLADETNIADQTSKSDVWQVHSILSETEPILEEMQDKLTFWTSKHKNLVEKAAHHRDQLDRIERLVSAAPAGMLIEPEKGQLIVLKDTLKVLIDTLTRLEVESFDLVEQELDQVQMSANEISTQLRDGYRVYPQLQKTLEELHGLQAETAELFDDLIKASLYPVVWDRSQNPFAELNKRVNVLGAVEKPRTLQEVQLDWIAAQELLASMRSLNRSTKQVVEFHEKLVGLVESEEIQQGLDRFAGYSQLAIKITRYNPENWTKSESASTFLEDVQKIEILHKSFISRDPVRTLPESEVELWLQKAGGLVEAHKKLHLRSQKLQDRLRSIQIGERNAKEEYETVQKALTQIKWLANSCAILKKITERGLNRLSIQSRRCDEQLSSPQTGVIEDKIHMVQKLKEAVEDAGHGWLGQLNQDVDQRIALLSEKVKMLDKIASLDDPALEKVRRLLDQETPVKPADKNIPSFHISLEEMVFELKARSLFWQELVAAQKELEEIVEMPLLDAFKHAEAQRGQAIDAMTKAAGIIPEQRSWPPSTVSIAAERAELSRLESERSALVQKPARAIWAVREYGELAASYQTLAGKLERSSEWALHEQKRISDLEGQIDRLNHQWQRQEQLDAADPQAVDQIRRVRAQAMLSLESQKQRWMLPSPDVQDAASYEEILQNLVEIVRLLRSFTVKMHIENDQLTGSQLNIPHPNGEIQDEEI